MNTNKRHSVAELQNDAWRTKPRAVSLWGINLSFLSFSYCRAGKPRALMSLRCWKWSLMWVNSEVDWSIDDREVSESTIFGNSIAWRKRVIFSQEAGDRVFSLQTVIIVITPVGCCIEGGAAAQSWTSCLFDRRGRQWHRSRRSWATAPAKSPYWRFLLWQFYHHL